MEPISRRTADAIVADFQNKARQPNPEQHQIYKPGERGAKLLPASTTISWPDSRLILVLLASGQAVLSARCPLWKQ